MRTALFYGNCQMLVLHDLLKPGLEACGIAPVHVQEVYMLNAEDQKRLRAEAETADIYIGQPVLPSAARPGSEELMRAAKHRVVMPSLHFIGYHQHLQVVQSPTKKGSGCLAVWSLVRRGMPADEIQEVLLADDAFEDDDVLKTVDASLDELERREREHGVTIRMGDQIRAGYSDRLLFHTINHPDRSVLIRCANLILEQLAAEVAIGPNASFLSDDGAPQMERAFASIEFLQHRILPGIARPLGISERLADAASRIDYRDRFKLPEESPTRSISILKLAQEYARVCAIEGWESGKAANDAAAAALPRPRRI